MGNFLPKLVTFLAVEMQVSKTWRSITEVFELRKSLTRSLLTSFFISFPSQLALDRIALPQTHPHLFLNQILPFLG